LSEKVKTNYSDSYTDNTCNNNNNNDSINNDNNSNNTNIDDNNIMVFSSKDVIAENQLTQ